MTIKELVTRLGFEVDDKAIKEFDKGMERAKASMLAFGAAAGATIGILYGVVKTAANSADHINKMALAAGVSTDDLQKLGYAADQSGSDMEEMGTSLRFLSRAIIDAKKPGNDTRKLFHQLGISATDAHGRTRNAADVFESLSGWFAKTTDQAKKTDVAMTLLGRSGGNMIELLSKGPEEIRRMTLEAEAFGIMTKEQIDVLKDFNDGLGRIFWIFGAIRNQVAAQLAPVLIEMIDDFRDFLLVNRDIIKQNLTGFIRGLIYWLKIAWAGFMAVGKAVSFLAQHLGGAEYLTKLFMLAFSVLWAGTTISGIMLLVSAVKMLVGAIGLANIAAAFFPFLIAAIGVAIALLVEDAYNFASGYKSVIGSILDTFPRLKSMLENFFGPSFETIFALIYGIKEGFLGWGDVFKLLGILFVNTLLAPMRLAVNTLAGLANLTPLGKLTGIGSGLDALANNLRLSTPTPTSKGLLWSDPAASPVQNKNHSVNVQATTTVTVPPGTPPGMVGDRVESGVMGGLKDILRRAGSALGPTVAY